MRLSPKSVAVSLVLLLGAAWFLREPARAQFRIGPLTNAIFAPAFYTGGGAGGGAAAPSVDLLLDFEGASVGLMTTNNLFDGAHTNGLAGYWNINPDPQVLNWVTNAENMPLYSPVKVAGVTYAGLTDSKSLSCRLTNNLYHEGRYNFIANSNQGQMALDFYFRIHPNLNLGDFSDLVYLETAGGEYATMSLVFDNPPTIALHSNTNFGSSSATITLTTNFFYHATLTWNTNEGPTGYSYLLLRNGTNDAFIDRRGLGHGAKQMVDHFRFGKENHSFAANTYRCTLDNLMTRLNMSSTNPTNSLW